VSSKPYLPWFPGDFKADTADLSLTAQAAYRNLIDHLWSHGGSVSSDRDSLLRASGLAAEICLQKPPNKRRKVEGLLKVFSRILEYFDEKNGKLSHHKITELANKAREISKIRAKAGRKGGQSKPKQKLPSKPYKERSVNKLTAKDAFWGAGEKAGIPRPLIGKMMNEYPEQAVSNAVAATVLKSPADPKAFFRKLLIENPKRGATPDWARIPFDDDELMPWAIKHGWFKSTQATGSSTYKQIRAGLRSKIEARRNREEAA